MPIYEYRCPSCGFQKDHLQKMSDAPLSTCPSCGAEGYAKLLSAAGFQLKGSGWYATDFKGGDKKTPEKKATDKDSSDSGPKSGGCGGGTCGGCAA